MIEGTIYNRTTGEIYLTAAGSDESILEAQLPLYPDSTYLVGEQVDGGGYYLPNGVKTPRPFMGLMVTPPEDHSAGYLHIDLIPEGTQAIGPNFDTVVNDGYLEWSSVEPGEYQVTLINFPYKHEVVNATFT